MKPVIIIALAFVLLVPTTVFAEEVPQWKGNGGDVTVQTRKKFQN